MTPALAALVTDYPVVNTGDRVTVTHGDVVATGTAAGAAIGGREHLVELDGTGAVVLVPDHMIERI